MRGFKTYIITKKTLIKTGIIVLSLIIIPIIITIFLKEPETATVFSDTAQKILDKGTVNEKSTTVDDIVENIIGFNPNEPTSIISSSSAGLNEDNLTTPTPVPRPEKPEETSIPLPASKEIHTATNLKINNATDYDVDLNELCQNPLEIYLKLDKPEVLIMHTHTTECYNGNEMTGESERTTNEKYNMCHIGEIVANTLKSHGIISIHDKTIHDYPSYQGAYTRALKTIEKNLEENPSIQVVLDIHRDAYIYSDGSKLRVTKEINGETSAQVMLVLGTDSMGLSHSNWKSNLTLAAKIQNTAEIMYPNLMRPLNLRRERFNMHATKGSLLLEIGSNGNSLQEAEIAAKHIGDALAAVLING